jgi:hypothetical protein
MQLPRRQPLTTRGVKAMDLETQVRLLLGANLALLLTLVLVTAGPPLLQELKLLLRTIRATLVQRRTTKALRRQRAMARAALERQQMRERRQPNLRVVVMPRLMPTTSSPSSAS